MLSVCAYNAIREDRLILVSQSVNPRFLSVSLPDRLAQKVVYRSLRLSRHAKEEC